MAIANTAHGGTANATSLVTSLAVTVSAVAGETIIVAVSIIGAVPTSVTDNKAGGSNTYAQIATSVTNNRTISLWATRAITSSVTSVTANFSSARAGIAVSTYTGINGFSTSNQNTATGSSSPATVNVPNTLQSGSFKIAGFAGMGGTSGNWSASTGNLRNNIWTGSLSTPAACIVDNNSAATCAAATPTSGAWAGTIVEAFSTLIQTCTETITITDTDTKNSVKNFTESVTVTDSITKDISKPLTAESITVSDVLSKAPSKVFSDSIALSDSRTNVISKNLLESITVQDFLSKQVGKTLVEGVTLSDLLSKDVSKSLLESITLSDSLAKTPSKTLSEVLTLVDSLQKVSALVVTLNEQIALQDALSKDASKTLDEQVSLTDSINRTIQATREFVEQILLEDFVTTSGGGSHFVQTLEEVLTILDVLEKSTAKSLDEAVVLSDVLSRGISVILTFLDSIQLVDTVNKGSVKPLELEQISLIDRVVRVLNPPVIIKKIATWLGGI